MNIYSFPVELNAGWPGGDGGNDLEEGVDLPVTIGLLRSLLGWLLGWLVGWSFGWMDAR